MPETAREGFAIVPLHLLGQLTAYELAVYVAVRAHYPNAFPSQKVIAEEAGMSLNTAKRALASLRAKGVLDWENQYRDNGGKTSNKYVIADEDGPDRPTHSPDRPMGRAPQAYPIGHTGPSRTKGRELDPSKGKRTRKTRAPKPPDFILECPKHGLDNGFDGPPCGTCKEARQNREIEEQHAIDRARALSEPIDRRGIALIGNVFGMPA